VRPIKLELQGFTSFRERCEIDFSKLDLFAITGPTGAGKSSLLDAITFALYGRTERLGKSGRELISQGAAAMQLTLEFKAGSEVYRVFRRIKPATATVRLEKKEPDGSWISVTSSIKQLEEEIVRLVGLQFDAFTRAVILPQGKFDQFLRGDSAKRKILLSELLNMSVYRTMMQQANQRGKERTEKASWAEQHVDNSVAPELLSTLNQAKAELEQQDSERQADLTAMEKAQPVARDLIKRRTELRMNREDAASAQKEREAAESQLTEQSQAASEKRESLKNIETEIQTVKYDPNEHLLLVGLARDAERLEEMRGETAKLRRQVREHKAELDISLPKIAAAEVAFQEAQHRLEAAQDAVTKARQEYSDLIARYGSAKTLDNLRADLETHNAKVAKRGLIEAELNSLNRELETRATTIEEAARQLAEAENRLNIAEATLEKIGLQNRAADLRQQLYPGDPCPVCEQTVKVMPETIDIADLDDAKRERKAAAKHVDERKDGCMEIKKHFELLTNKIALKVQELQECSDSTSAIRAKLISALGSEPGPGSPAQIDALKQSLEKAQLKADELGESVESCRKAYALHDHQLHGARHTVELIQQKINGLESRIDDLQSQTTEVAAKLKGHPELNELRKELKGQENAKIKMDGLGRERDSVRKSLEKLEKTVIALKTQAAEAARRHDQAVAAATEAAKKEQSLLKKLRKMLADTPLTEGAELDELDQRIHDLNDTLTSIRLQLEKNRAETESVTAKLKQNQKLREEAEALRKSAAIYHELAVLLDLKNFQQYLLSASFKRLAVDGSTFMEDLTNGRYSFTCNGDDFQVQDHWNGDDERSVSTLSGGEAFLASLSLALALAQGIAELSGERGAVALESLFLDEGFSTLDSETLGKVADALPLLQNGGRMIGVITHVQGFAEQLPSQIEIIKTPTGSRVVIGEEPLDLSASA
jgi:DNA repair protein SbcC/Rad50